MAICRDQANARKVYSMGAANERVPVSDLLTTAKVHVSTIIDFLAKPGS